ncbi:septation protein SpoVG family protein [uncultured Oscillibacter sp.]|uniref:septation protein SpoVG family protein n=1 Tax=uncultured Oscillibacter sp. TaxID=876091 RepID=UPI0025D03D69|nr:septation protein SpoVG family protein [uncultured Oscillibacter sp.]
MPRRYKLGPDGEMRRTWDGKLPEEFGQRDMLAFMADTDLRLSGKVSKETLAAINAAGYDYEGGAVMPRPGKEDEDLSKDIILTPEQIAAEERRWLFEAPIAELAEVKGVTIDEAVKMRTDAVLQEAAIPIEVSVRPIEPQGKLIGFASVNFGGVVVDDFKVVNGQNGIFLGAPSKPDPTSRTGYRSTVRITDRATQERLNAAGVEAYHTAVEKLIARAEAVRPAPIREQMDKAGKEAAQKNAARSAPAKGKEGRDAR